MYVGRSIPSSIFAVVCFVLFDAWPNFLKEKVRWAYGVVYSVFLIGIFPLSLYLANSSNIDLFTGREDIWKQFYDTLFKVRKQFLVGMPPFTFKRGEQVLGNHNSYNAILGGFGLIGLVLISLFILYNIWSLIIREETQAIQFSFIIAFCYFVAINDGRYSNGTLLDSNHFLFVRSCLARKPWDWRNLWLFNKCVRSERWRAWNRALAEKSQEIIMNKV